MKVPPLYPPELNQASDKEKQVYFFNVVLEHDSLKAGLACLKRSSSPFIEQRLILLLGGAGTGKTALMKTFVNDLLKSREEAMKNDAWLVPALFLEADAPLKGPFDFSQVFAEGLEQSGSILVNRTLPIVARAGRPDLPGVDVDHRKGGPTEPSLNSRFLKSIRERKTEAVCIDEAVNVFNIGSTKRSHEDRIFQLKTQGNKLKTLINRAATSLILGGAYDFFEMTLGSSQLARRSRIVHLESYLATPAGLASFVDVLIKLLSHMPIEHDINPELHATEFFAHSLGGVGLLKNILTSSMTHAHLIGSRLTMEIVRQNYLAAAQLATISRETTAGIEAIRQYMSPEAAAEQAFEMEKKAAVASRKLKPGETTPSHRKGSPAGVSK